MTKKIIELELSKNVLKGISDMGYEVSTPIQSESIPVGLSGKDIIGQAQTGTGKTLAFSSVILSKMEVGNKLPTAIIISPTRELAIQIDEELRRIGKHCNVKSTCVYGGSGIESQIRTIKRGVDVIIGTPGRILDLIRRKVLKLSNIDFVVLDEADEMLKMGFREDIEDILSNVTSDHQTLLFSATMPKEIKDIAHRYMKEDNEHIIIKKTTKTADTVEQFYYNVKLSDKFETLCRLIDWSNITTGIIFCKTKRSVDQVTELMQKSGYLVEAMHGDLPQNHRMNTLSKFKQGIINFLVATDVAARGIDVSAVSHVINYELPQDIDSYIHRIGRTGRANSKGKAYSLITNKDLSYMKQIARVTKSDIAEQKVPTLKEIRESQLMNLLSEVEENVYNTNLKSYQKYIDQIPADRLGKFTAALLHMTYESRTGYNYTREEINSPKQERQGKNKKRSKHNEVRIFMTIGKVDGINNKQLVDFISKSANIKKSKIGSVDVMKRFSFVSVDKDIANEVVKSCNKLKYNGRKITFEKANK